METSRERIMEVIQDLSRLTDTPGEGVTRFSYGELDRKARDYIVGKMKEMGLTVTVDPVGNLRGRWEGKHPQRPPMLVGSHLDSVRCGGPYDGITGVACALEAVRTLMGRGKEPQRPVEVIVFAEEEGSNFGTTMVGSKALVGKLRKDGLHFLHTPQGETAFDKMKAFGLHPEQVEEYALHPGDIHGMVELHVEQGAVLWQEGKTIGVVEDIAGMTTLRVTVKGDSNHAGATPMGLRKDALAAAGSIIGQIPQLTENTVSPHTVATVGSIQCFPNMPNVIPGQVEFTVDIRDSVQAGIDQVVERLTQKLGELADARQMEVKWEIVGRSDCIHLNEEITGIIEEEAREMAVSYKRLPSGAVHDAALMSSITRAGMIFVPSVKGKSHCPEEYTPEEEIQVGCDLLVRVIDRLTC